LVTGGAGFIGSHITNQLADAGAEVVVYDNMARPAPPSIGHSEVRVVTGDILDYDRLRTACRGADVISHHAAQLEVTTSLSNPLEDLRINTEGTLNVLRAAHEVKARKVILASSACVYGEAQYVPQDENHPTEPNWPYGVSKLAMEKYAHVFSAYYQLPIVSIRYAITYGENEWYGRVLTAFTKRAIEGKPPVVWGDGKQVRDFTYVGDAARLHSLLIQTDEVLAGEFNASTGVGTTISELAALFSRTFHLGLPVTEAIAEGEESREVHGRVRLPLELKRMVLANDKARALGWKPTIGLEEGVRREMAWAREHLDHWQRPSA